LLLVGSGGIRAIVAFGVAGRGEGRHGACQSCESKNADQCVFHDFLLVRFQIFMKASCDCPAFFGMQNRIRGDLFLATRQEYFFEKRE
jgi:hypothetical protein